MSGFTLHSASRDGLLAFSVDGVFSKEECEEWLAHIDKNATFESALINDGTGNQVLATDVRHHKRWMEDDKQRADMIWDRLKDHIKANPFSSDIPVGLNERLRVLKYHPGDYFMPHYDLTFRRPGSYSLLTVMIYLNDGFEGGDTVFLDEDDLSFRYVYKPKQGSVLIFDHDILHEGAILVSGEKIAVRTDVLFENPPFTDDVDHIS